MSEGQLGFVPDWPAPARVRAFVTERGPGDGRFGGLNLATHVGDEPGRVAANRAALAQALELPSAPVWLTQVHGARVLDLDAAPLAGVAEADGAVTRRPGVVCAVMAADCLPVLFCDRAGTCVGIAHAGWRGLAAGVLPAAVAALDVAPRELMAWLGPAIGPAAYEVGPEVREAFVATAPEAVAGFTRNARGRFQADLYGLARASLAGVGVRAVHGGGFCTYAEAKRFFSHRREGSCGRMAALIWLAPAGEGPPKC